MNNCYFYSTKKDGNVYVVPLCMECHAVFTDLGWFWPGAEKGYGPYKFECEKCKKVIYDGTT